MTIEELENDFINVYRLCLDNDDLVNEFCRLKGLKRPDKRSPIDNACGYDAGMDFMRQFTDFVREFVYISLLRQQIG